MTKREITKLEKQIVNDIMSKSNYSQEKASEIARVMIVFGYTIHEQENTKLIRENNSLRAFVGNLQICREREASKIEELEKKNQELKNKIKLLENEIEYIVQAYRILKEVLNDRV